MKKFNLDSESKITSGFKTPDNYFDSFSKKMFLKLNVEQPKVISLKDRIDNNKKWFFAIASVILVTLSIVFYTNEKNKMEQKYTAEIENYLTNHSSFTDDELVNLLDKEDISKIKIDSKLKNDAIEELLIDNTDLEQIITN